jgi:hypothetical protein
MHIRNGNFQGRPISPIVRNAPWVPLLQELDGVIDVASIECSYFAEWAERDAFAAMPQSMQLAAGIVGRGLPRVRPTRADAATGATARRGELWDRDGQESPRPGR